MKKWKFVAMIANGNYYFSLTENSIVLFDPDTLEFVVSYLDKTPDKRFKKLSEFEKAILPQSIKELKEKDLMDL